MGPTYVDCLCPPGLVGNGIGPFGCTPSTMGNPCSPNPCVHGTCSINNSTGGYLCRCSIGFKGSNCETRGNPCEPNPCQNGGVCMPQYGYPMYRCICTASYTGVNCQREREGKFCILVFNILF